MAITDPCVAVAYINDTTQGTVYGRQDGEGPVVTAGTPVASATGQS